MFHYECVIKKLKNRWNGPRIVFNYTSCTLCKSELKLKGDFKEIDIMIDAKKKLKALVTREAIERLEIEGRMNERIEGSVNEGIEGRVNEWIEGRVNEGI